MGDQDDAESSAAHDPSDVVLTTAAKSKAYRLLSAREVREAVADLDGQLYRRGDSEEYHLVLGDHAVSLRPEGDTIVVVTQMHVHNDYEGLDTYREVSGF